MNATTQLLTTLRSGACLKLGGRSHRFFLLKNSTQLPADQAAARKLASDGTLRPHGIDSHGKAMEKEASYPPAARRASSNPARHVRSVLPNAEALHPAMRAASACRMPSTSTRRAASRWGPWRRRRSWARA